MPPVALHGLPDLRGIRQIANRYRAPATMRYCDPGIVPFGRLCNSARSRRGGDPQPIAVADDLADGVAERAQAEGLADDEAVHRDRED